MRIVVSGSSGLVGTALVAELRAAGHSVTRLVRRANAGSGRERLVSWNPSQGKIDGAALEAHDAIVHLAGESLIGLWTRGKKQAIRESRVQGTALLARTVASLHEPPRVLVCASAIGYYGDRRPNEPLDESATRGNGFLADVVAEWETASHLARATSRVVNTRFGLVLSGKGGALAPMLPLFRCGLGGTVGSGEQVWSWIGIEDVVRGILHVIKSGDLSGPVNFTAPNPVTNYEFTRTLGRVLHRPTLFRAPAFAIRLLLREMGEEMLLAGANAVPAKLLQSGYQFKFPQLETALKAVVRSSSDRSRVSNGPAAG